MSEVARMLWLIVGVGAVPALPAQEDVAHIASEEIELPFKAPRVEKGREAIKKSYFLIGPKKGAAAPKDGYGLLVVMPGGDGGRGFHPFVKRIYEHALGDDWVAAQPIAVRWTEEQVIVWPTKGSPVKGMKFTTEELVEDAIADVRSRLEIDPERVFVLAWSSSGPAAYAISLSKNTPVTGSFVAMSVFKPRQLGSLRAAKGAAYYLYHSPDDKTCPFRMAEDAEKQLGKKGAKVELATYEGGHGWRGNVYGALREGVRWLEANHAKPPKKNAGTRR
jgi:predicted esterase